MVDIDKDQENDRSSFRVESPRAPEGEVRGNQVYPLNVGKRSDVPFAYVGKDNKVYPIIYGPKPKHPAPIGHVKDGKFYRTIY
jgi:hypothetical protein